MIRRYGFGIIRLAFEFFNTKVFYSKARLIRLPFDIRGKRYVRFGKGFTTGRGCRIEACPLEANASPTLIVGDNVQINDYVHITAMSSVILEDNVLLASKIYISDCSHGFYEGNENDSSPLEIPKDRAFSIKPVVIRKNAWLGEFVSVLPGVEIGEGAIIGSNSVVSKSIPPFTIAVGVPAKVIKKYNFDSKKWEKVK